MPRSGVNGTYNVPPGTDNQQPLTVISSAMFNAFAGDVQQTFNTPQPIAYGGTNATTPIGAMDNLMTKGTDVATAATLNLDTASGQFVDLTGTTTVTAVTLSEGRHRMTRAAGNFQITVGASLIGNGGGANIAVQTGDLIFWEGYSGGVVRFWVIKPYSPPTTSTPVNLATTATVSVNALTISIKGHNGNDPSSGNPVYIPFRSATANSGDVDVLALTAATSLVVSSGSTLGTANGVSANLLIVGFNDGGTFRLGIINPTSAQTPLADGIASSTAEGGAGAADSQGVFYTGTAVSSKPYTVLGWLSITEATAGTWVTAPTLVQTEGAPSTAISSGAFPLSREFVSAQISLGSNTGGSVAHGLGVRPKLYHPFLQCVIAEQGYSVGDEILVPPMDDNGSVLTGVMLSPDTTNITYRFGNSGTWVAPNKTTGGRLSLSTANWRLVIRAWA